MAALQFAPLHHVLCELMLELRVRLRVVQSPELSQHVPQSHVQQLPFDRLDHLLSQPHVQVTQEASDNFSFEASATLLPQVLCWGPQIPARGEVMAAVSNVIVRVSAVGVVLKAPGTKPTGTAGTSQRTTIIITEVHKGQLAAWTGIGEEIVNFQYFGVDAPLLLIHPQQPLQLPLHLDLLLLLHLRGELRLHDEHSAPGKFVKDIARYCGCDQGIGEGQLTIRGKLWAMQLGFEPLQCAEVGLRKLQDVLLQTGAACKVATFALEAARQGEFLHADAAFANSRSLTEQGMLEQLPRRRALGGVRVQ